MNTTIFSQNASSLAAKVFNTINDLLLGSILLIALSGCSDIEKRNLSDANLAQASASVLGARSDQIVISQRQAVSKKTLLFTATINGQRNRCTLSTKQLGLRLSPVQCLRHVQPDR